MEDSIEQPVVVSVFLDGGAWQFQGYDENGLCRSLNRRLTCAHKVLCSAGEIACKGRQDFCFGCDGGFMIPVHSKIGHAMRMHFERLVSWYGRKTAYSSLHPREHLRFLFEQRSEVHRNQYCERFSAAGRRVWQSSALVSPMKTLNTALAPSGDDVESIEAPT